MFQSVIVLVEKSSSLCGQDCHLVAKHQTFTRKDPPMEIPTLSEMLLLLGSLHRLNKTAEAELLEQRLEGRP